MFLSALLLKIQIFWDVTLCLSVNSFLRFDWVKCRHLKCQGILESNSKTEAVRFIETSLFALVWLIWVLEACAEFIQIWSVVEIGYLIVRWCLKDVSSVVKGKAVPLQAWTGPGVSRKLRLPDYMTTAQKGGKVVKLMHRPPLPPGNTRGTHFC